MTREQVFSWFFFGIFIFLIYLFYLILKPFIFSLFWAGILALALYPIHERLTKALRNKPGTSSAIMTVLAIFVIVIPLGMIVTSLAVETVNVFQEIKGKVEGMDLGYTVERLKGLLPESVLEEVERRYDILKGNPGQILSNRAGTIGGYVFDQVQTIAGNLTSFLINLGVMIFALFFFFKDGRKFYEEMKFLIPMTDEQKDRIFSRFNDTLNATVLGIIATAMVQGFLLGLIFWTLGIPFPVLAGVLAFIFSLLPVGGSGIVWLPVGIYLIFTGSVFRGAALMALGALLVGSIDNILRPIIIGQRTRLNELFLLLSILGAIQVFGFSGLILGPVLLAIFMSFVEIYRVEYREAKSGSKAK